MFWMILACGAVFAAFLLVASRMDINVGPLAWLILLLCPLLHLFMHRRHGRKP